MSPSNLEVAFETNFVQLLQGDKVDAITCEPSTLEGCNDKEQVTPMLDRWHVRSRACSTSSHLHRTFASTCKTHSRIEDPHSVTVMDIRLLLRR